MFGDTIIDDAQRQVTLNLKQWPGTNLKNKILYQSWLFASFKKVWNGESEFSDALGQLTLLSVMGSDQSNI